MNPLVIDKRHMHLQTWFNKVLNTPKLATSPEVVTFLEEHKLDESLVEIEVSQFVFYEIPSQVDLYPVLF